jgi:zinc protease
MTLEVESQKTNQQQVLTEMKVMGNVMQKQVVNKDYAYIEMQGQKMDLEGKLFEQMLADAAIFPELNLDLDTVELVGITEVDGKKAYEVKITEGMLNFYDVESHLKIQVSQTVEIMGNSQTNVVKMNDYKEVNSILFPYKTVMSMGPQEIELITQNIELNTEIDSEIFK